MLVELTLKRNWVGNSFVRTVCLVSLAVFLYIQKTKMVKLFVLLQQLMVEIKLFFDDSYNLTDTFKDL